MIKRKITRTIGPLLGLLLFVIALFILHKELKDYSYHDMIRSLGEIPVIRLYMALGLTILNYLVMTGYDHLALRYIRYSLPYGKIAFASFIGYAFNINMGLSMLAGGSVRYRLYSAWGLSVVEITKVVAFYTLTLWLGLGTVAGMMFLLEPLALPSLLRLPFSSVRPFGILFLVLVGGYLFLTALYKRPLKIRGWEFSPPSVKLSFFQMIVASSDWVLAGSVLYVLLAPSAALSFPAFLSIFLLAQMAGALSQIPGGLGVFEAIILTFISPILPVHSILGILLAYRVIYYFLPLGFATLLLGTYEVFQRKAAVRRAALIIGQWIPGLVPNAFAFAIFVSGAVLIFSGSIPVANWHLVWLKDLIPLPVIEISHFLASLVGVGLLFLAWGIQRRLDGAYLLTIILLAAGVVLSLLKGLEYREALVLLGMLMVLLPSRHHFYRKASLVSQRFTVGWIAAIILVLLCSVWLGFFSYKHIEYSNELWWRFALFGKASRFLRATVGAVGTALFISLMKLLRPAAAKPLPPNVDDFKDAHSIIQGFAKTYANLALLGDKGLLFNEDRTAFLMYGVEGRSWVALGDPVGPEKDMREMAWRFHDMADRYDGWTVFYEVYEQNIDIYLDLGLSLLKIGEEARIPLETSALERSKNLRHLHHKVEKKGCIFRIVSPAEIHPVLPELKKISDAWLGGKNTREKRFSLGFFDEEYLQNFQIGTVEQDKKIVAFCNVFCGAGKEELSADLMRHLPDAPNSVMDYLFIELMRWGKGEGYRWFNMGLAPLSGLKNQTSAIFWNYLGSLVYQYGERFYNFQGLREYKEKFDPVWKPKYLASPRGLKLPRILTNIATLISGGLKGVVAK
jgi:phosphatidylglycerol lysyltransferase